MNKQPKTKPKRKVPIKLFAILVLVTIVGVWIYQNSGSNLVYQKQTVYDEKEKQIDDLRCIETLLVDLRKKAKFETTGTGEYRKVGGHHPLAKSAFQNNTKYNEDLAFTISESTLDRFGEPETHKDISGHQNRLYNTFANRNPGKRLTIEKLAEIEILSMYYAGINDSVATGWVILALEDLKKKGITEITNIPWKGENPIGDEITGLNANCW